MKKKKIDIKLEHLKRKNQWRYFMTQTMAKLEAIIHSTGVGNEAVHVFIACINI